MFEARLAQGSLLKKVLEALKELVQEGNFDCNTTGISLQAMDSSHVSLCNLLLRYDGFEHYRCDRNMTLGINLKSLATVMKCSGNDDSVTLKSEENCDTVNIMFESADQDKISDFELKLMDIDSEHLGIPETEYKAVVQMPANEFQRICRDMSALGDSIVIAVTKEGVKFTVSGEIGNGNVTVKPNSSVDNKEEAVVIQIDEPVTQTFALRYMNHFAKATPLSGSVHLSMSPDVPLLVEYKIEEYGHLRYYLAPKIDESQ